MTVQREITLTDDEIRALQEAIRIGLEDGSLLEFIETGAAERLLDKLREARLNALESK